MKKFKDAFCNFLIICFIILGFIASVALMTFIMWLITLTANITFRKLNIILPRQLAIPVHYPGLISSRTVRRSTVKIFMKRR